MKNKSLDNPDEPQMTFPEQSDGKLILLEGQWTLRMLAASSELRQKITKVGAVMDKQWDISRIEHLDSAGAFLLWQAWNEQLPAGLIMRPEHKHLFDYWHDRNIPAPQPMLPDLTGLLRYWLMLMQGFYRHIMVWLIMFGRLILDFIYLLQNPRAAPYKEISLTIYKAGASAMGITALVSFLVGISLSYLSSLQLYAT